MTLLKGSMLKIDAAEYFGSGAEIQTSGGFLFDDD